MDLGSRAGVKDRHGCRPFALRAQEAVAYAGHCEREESAESMVGRNERAISGDYEAVKALDGADDLERPSDGRLGGARC